MSNYFLTKLWMSDEDMRLADYDFLVDFRCRVETHIAVLRAACHSLVEILPGPNQTVEAVEAFQNFIADLCHASARFERIIEYRDRIRRDECRN